jgi:hypothetical protein
MSARGGFEGSSELASGPPEIRRGPRSGVPGALVSSPTGDALPDIAVLCDRLGILDTGDSRTVAHKTLFLWPTFGCQSCAVASVLSPGRFEVHDTIAAAIDPIRQLAQQPTLPSARREGLLPCCPRCRRRYLGAWSRLGAVDRPDRAAQLQGETNLGLAATAEHLIRQALADHKHHE